VSCWDGTKVQGPALSSFDPMHKPDYDAIAVHHERRDRNKAAVESLRADETTDLPTAIAGYLAALGKCVTTSEWRSKRTSFRARVRRRYHHPRSMSICLIKAGRPAEAISVTDQYFRDFPSDLDLSASAAIQKRVNKHRGLTQGAPLSAGDSGGEC
jgi:hypothetical protein